MGKKPKRIRHQEGNDWRVTLGWVLLAVVVTGFAIFRSILMDKKNVKKIHEHFDEHLTYRPFEHEDIVAPEGGPGGKPPGKQVKLSFRGKTAMVTSGAVYEIDPNTVQANISMNGDLVRTTQEPASSETSAVNITVEGTLIRREGRYEVQKMITGGARKERDGRYYVIPANHEANRMGEQVYRKLIELIPPFEKGMSKK